MPVFEDIPATGNALVGQSDDETAQQLQNSLSNSSVGGSAEKTSHGCFLFNGKYLYPKYLKPKIDSKEEFEENLMAILPAGGRLFGRSELHEDGTLHYNVVLPFLEKTHWKNALSKLAVEVDTNAMWLEKPNHRQRISEFLVGEASAEPYVKAASGPWPPCPVLHSLSLLSLIAKLMIFTSFPRVTIAVPTSTDVPLQAHDKRMPALMGSLPIIAALILIILVPGAAYLLVTLKRMSAVPVWGILMSTMAFGWWCIRKDATTTSVLSGSVFIIWWISGSVFIIWGISSVQFWNHAFGRPTTSIYTLLVVIFMAMVLDILMVHYMTTVGAALSQADILNASLPSVSLSLGITAIVLAAHRQRHLERPLVYGVEKPIEEQLESSTENHFNRPNGSNFDMSPEDSSEMSADPRQPEAWRLLMEMP